MSKKTLSSILFAIAISICLSGMVIGQEITGSIVGIVRDAAGAAVPGANVTITDPSKGGIVIRSATTNDSGEYSAPNLPISTYSVTVEAANFKKAVRTEVKVDVGQRRGVDVTLEAGNINETVTVTADAASVDLQSATSGTVINGDQVREIPINNRNFVQLVALAPGVTNDLADQVYVGTTNPDGQANIVSISVNGARSSQNTWTVDGADITDRGSNITIQAYPSVDSIGEFRVLRSLYPAEAGRSGGGQVNIVTRSGASRFHGSAFEFVRNEAFNANSFLNNAVTTPQFGRGSNGKAKRPPFRYNNFGFTFSGPIYFLNFGEHDPGDGYFTRYKKTFFFFSEEVRIDRRFSAAVTTTVPDAFLRAGRFPIPVCINLRPSGTCTGANILPANTPINPALINPVAQAYLTGVYNNLPLPNASTVGNPWALSASLRGVADFRQEILKIDHSFSDKWSMYYRFGNDKIPTIDANALFSSGSGLPGVSTTSTNSPGRTHTFQTTYVVAPNVIVEGRYTQAYGAILSENVGTLALANTQVPVTLPFINQRDRIPSLSGNGFTALGSFGPYDNFSTKKNANASLTWIMGSHTMKFGAAYSIYRKNENALAGVNEGNFSAFDPTLPTGQTFPQNYTTPNGTVLTNAITATVAGNLQRWANFLVGNVQTFTQAHFDATADLRQKTVEAYAQDEWRVRNNLTLYFGLRYSYYPSPWDENGRLSNFVPSLWSAAAAPQVTGAGNRISGVTGVNTGNWCNGAIVNAQNFTTGPAVFNCTPTASPFGKYVIDNPKKDFAPRVGMAWDPFGKGTTAVRMGYGIYHEQVLVGTFLQNIGLNPPYQENATATATNLSNPAGSVPTIATVQGLRAIQSDWNTPYMQHWSLDVQRQLTSKTVVTVGYYGSKGTHLIGLTELNSLPPGKALSSQCAVGAAYYGQTPAPTLVTCQPAGYTFRNTATATGNPNGAATDLLILDQLRPYKGFRSIAMVQPRYGSNYHSMQLSGQHRFSGASQVNLAYTWSKNLTDSQNDRTASPVNQFNTKAEWARAALDRRHVLSVNYVYELPFFNKQQGFVGKVLGGWQASGIVTYNTGLPFTATTSNYDPAGLGIINANPTARPNQLCDPNVGAPHTQQNWVNVACFQLNPLNTAVGLPNTVGNAARGTINGPPTTRVDFTMAKNIRFGESISVQLRGEVFNIANHTNFRAIATNVSLGTFGNVTTVRDPRTMQFGAKFSF
ncbi:MAG: carboxypeptidase regulatory-like domain-containing protein [Pyrinomonadaceae bacterium]